MRRRPPPLPSVLTRTIACALVVAGLGCGTDQGPLAEQDIDGTWGVVGLYAFDVEGRVRCNLSGTLVLQSQSGVNTIQGTGQHSFDCRVDGAAETVQVNATLANSRLVGAELTLTLGSCNMVAGYDRTRPDVIQHGRSFCQMSFAPTGTIHVAGTWEGHREIAP